jgi:hypothetical protein
VTVRSALEALTSVVPPATKASSRSLGKRRFAGSQASWSRCSNGPAQANRPVPLEIADSSPVASGYRECIPADRRVPASLCVSPRILGSESYAAASE